MWPRMALMLELATASSTLAPPLFFSEPRTYGAFPLTTLPFCLCHETGNVVLNGAFLPRFSFLLTTFPVFMR